MINILINHCNILNVLCAICKFQGGKRFPVAFLRRSYHNHHRGLAVPSKGITEEASELGVPVRDVRTLFLVSEGRDNISKRRQTEVNILTLLQTLPTCTSNPYALGTSKINKIKLPNFYLFRAIISDIPFWVNRGHLLNDDDEDGVGAT